MTPTPLERIAEAIVHAVPHVLTDVEAGAPIILPRGADPFAGTERPLLLAATRWTAVSPGGVLIGGSPNAVSTVLGFELPERPEASADASLHRRATDAPAGDDPTGGDEPNADGDDAETPEEQPAGEQPGDESAAEGDADGDAAQASDDATADADGEEGAAAAPSRRWSDHVVEAAKAPAATAGDGFIRELATLVGLPHGAAATQAVLAESDAMVASAVGPLPDAIVVPLRRGDTEIRLVIVVAGIVSARVAAAAVQVGSASGPGVGPVEGADAAEPAAAAALPPRIGVGGVPIEVCAEIGTTRMPLSSVLALREGAVVELAEAVEAPVALVSGTAHVATGELEVDATGQLLLHVTGIPGRPDLTAGPTLVDEAAPAGDGDDSAA